MGDLELEKKLTALFDSNLVKWKSVSTRMGELNLIRETVASSKKNKKFKDGMRLVKALNHSTRFDILISLDKGASCPCELEYITGLSQATVSHHLTILEEAGLISRDRRGKRTILKSEKPEILEAFFNR